MDPDECNVLLGDDELFIRAKGVSLLLFPI